MKAITTSQFGTPDVLEYVDLPEPMPETNEVRVRLYAAGVNPADTYVTTGTYAFYKPELPFTPGFDGAGVIDAVGEGVADFAIGDRVFVAALLAARNTGTYAEKAVCDAAVVHPLPADVSYEAGAALGVPGLAAYRALFQRAGIKPGETVLIHGASGGVGILAVQMASAIGAKVIGTASTDAGRQLILQAGAAHAIPHINREAIAEVSALTAGQGPDVIIEMLANVNLETDLDMIAKYGRIVVVGNRGSLDFNPRGTMAKEADILGMAIWNFTPRQYSEALHAIRGFLRSGVIKPVVGEELPLAQAGAAQAAIIDHQSQGKMVLKMD